MKKPTPNNLQSVFAIYAEDKKGLIGQVLIYFNRKSYDVSSLNVARTDISDLVLITLEATVPANQLQPFTERLKKIIEVYAIQTFNDRLKKTGFYRMAAPALDNTLWLLMGKYGAQLSSMGADTFVICKTGSDEDLQQLYAQLEARIYWGFAKAG